MTRLLPEKGCQNQMLWNYTLPEKLSLESFVQQLTDAGWADQSKPNMPLFILTHTHDEHRLLLVKVTRRVQLRLFYLTPKDQREHVANTIARAFDDICDPFW